MKKFAYAKGLAIFAVTALFTITNSVPALASKFTSPDGNFNINFRGTPVEESQEVETDEGPITLYTFTATPNENIVFIIAYSDIPTKPIDRKGAHKMLKATQSGQLGNEGMNFGLETITEEKKNSYKKYPGLFYKADKEDLFIATQIYLVEKRLYQIMVMKSDKPLKLGEINSFIKSFKLLDR